MFVAAQHDGTLRNREALQRGSMSGIARNLWTVIPAHFAPSCLLDTLEM